MRAEGAVGGEKDEEVHAAVGDGDPQDSGINLVTTVGKDHHTRGNVMLTERW